MNVLITGIEGFVGPYLARLYVADNNVIGSYHDDPEERMDGVDYRFMDVTDADSVSQTVEDVKPDLIFHLAGFSSVGESWKFPEKAFSINAGGTKNILDAVLDSGLRPRILVVSSSEIYGNHDGVLSEDTELKPIGPYAESRLKQESLIASYPELDVVVARSFPHTGPGQMPKFVCSSFAQQVARIEKGLEDSVIRHGNLSPVRDFSDVRDVVKAYRILADKGLKHDTYNVCSGKAVSINDLLDELIGLSDTEIRAEPDPDRFRPADISGQKGSNEKIVSLGWRPEMTLRQTLNDMLNYWRERV